MVLSRITLFLLLLIAFRFAESAVVWTTTCSAASRCSASVRSKSAAGATDDDQLRVSRYETGRREVVFTAPARPPGDEAIITVYVDGRPATRLVPETDYRRLRSRGTLLIQPHASEVLLGAMRRAKQVSFAYRTVDGSETVVLLPLQGFSQAMQRIGVALPSDGHAKADSERPGSTQAAPAKQLLRAPRAISSEAKRSSRSSSAPTAQGSSQLPTALIPRFAALDVAIADLRARTPEDWSRFLPELLPAIQACIERTPGSGVFVTKAWLMSKGLVGVRTRNTTVGWFDCVARREGRHVERFDPVTQTGERLPGEEYIVFTATPESLPEGDCFSREQVVDDANQSIGWLSRYGCAKNATGSRR